MSKRWLAWAAVPALLVSACGGGDDDEGADAADWCALAQEVEDAEAALDDVAEGDREAMRASLEEFRDRIDAAARSAPEAILAEVNTAADGVDEIADIFDAADYDLGGLGEEELRRLEDVGTDMDAATARIDEYLETECGISTDGDADDTLPPDTTPGPTTGSTPPPSTAAPTTDAGDESAGTDPDSPWCVAAGDVDDVSDRFEAMDFADPAEVEETFTELLDTLQKARSVAPDEIRDEVELLVASFEDLRDALEAVDYDFLAADLSVLDDPDGAIDTADLRIEQYNEDVCGIPAEGDTPALDDSADDGFDPNAGSIRDQTIAQLVAAGFTEEEAACVFDSIDFTDPSVGEDLEVIMGVFEQCGIDLARLAELGEGL